jgi:CubicO group peptidase (beta-lactamase class C family)
LPLSETLGLLVPPFAFAGVAMGWPDGREVVETRAAPGLEPEGFFRAASVSKIITGRVFRRAAAGAGLTPPYAVAASELLGWDLRHPRSEVTVTAGMIAAHCSGLSDAGGYLHAGPLRDWPMVWGAAPGEVFDYCNLGYLLLAAMAEQLTGERFDVMAARELARIGVVGGFNWLGVPEGPVLPTFRRDGDRLVAQIDAGRVVPQVAEWTPGEVPGLFSPQGGLRVTLAGMLRIARSLSEADGPVIWDGPVPDADVWGGYGVGVQFIDRPAFWPRPVMGHFGNAYGFVGGAWKDRDTGVAFAVALNGVPVGDEDDGLRPEERLLYARLAELAERMRDG